MINFSIRKNYDKIAQEGKIIIEFTKEGRNFDKIVPRGMKGWLPTKLES